MQDRELLELAAKAAGIGGGWGDKIEYHNGAVDLRDVWILGGDDFVPWNPLTDDGDALRLAVAINRMMITYSDEDWEYCGHDGYAATRRAIVRAAAEVGKAA